MSFNVKCAGISVCILLQAVESLKKKKSASRLCSREERILTFVLQTGNL